MREAGAGPAAAGADGAGAGGAGGAGWAAAAEVIATLGMRAHPEGGWFTETWRAPSVDSERPAGSAILYMLAAGERSHSHRVDADEFSGFELAPPGWEPPRG